MTIGSHQQSVGKDQARFTPRWIWEPLAPFDTDVCAGDPRPWDCATRNITIAENSLSMNWAGFGRIWLNPPFNRYVVGDFVRKMCDANDGILLLHVRPETEWFAPIWTAAAALLFLASRVIFCKADGSPITIENPEAKHYGKKANSGAPVVLAAFGFANADALAAFDLRNNPATELRGNFVPLIVPRSVLVMAIGDRTWREVIREFLRGQTGPVQVAELYIALASHPKVRGRPNWKPKIRQTLLRGAGRRVARDQWVCA